ncbi:S-layer homology domain-containing protein [Paenibacillus koleovorans]|uniref:S-layer homology domain-containing protein n=1 Tax=Paenibacillus koleovorans TaxID=121608 RepID=UPI0013E3072F|nr:S-layer homology domain-containing protein [Paenibacillus koleovorans]
MNKLLKQLLVFTIIIQLFAVSVWTQEAYATSGTLSDPHIIMDEVDLSDIRNDLTAHYRLGANIDLSGYDFDGAGPDTGGWLPIGAVNDTTANPFTGSLDGNGYTISNLKMDRPTMMFVGLFGKIDGAAKLSDIRLRDIQVVGNIFVGGLVGNQVNGTIERSSVTGTIRVAASSAGGLVGVLASGIIENSYAVVDVSGWTRIGGLVGTNAGTIRNAYAAGWVNGNIEIGGLVGYNVNATARIESSYAAGSVNGNSPVGGLTGDNVSGGSSANSYWNLDTTGQAGSVLGTGVTSEQMKNANTFGWNSSVWGIIEGMTYPYLRAFGMGIGVDPLAVTTYSLKPGQDAVSVTGSVYHESATEPIDVQYIIRDSTGATVTNATYATMDSDAMRPINRRFSLSGYANGDYTLTVMATDSHRTAVGTTLAFTVNASAAAPPTVHFTNNNEAWTQAALTTVTINDSGGGVDASTLQYVWSTDSATPGPGAVWTLFANGGTLSRSGVSGDVYLHIRVQDLTGNTANVASNRFRLDNVAPTIDFSTNGSETLAPTASTTVTVTDAGGGVDASSLQYAWTQTAAVPANGWTAFTSGDTLTKAGADGDWYLHIQAKDNLGNSVNMASDPFLLDNIGPSVNITMTKADTNPYPDNTWTNQDVTVSTVASDTNSVMSITYSLDSGATWRGYTAPIVLQDDSVHSVSFKAVDSVGNETVEQRTVKISKSGLRLTPTLTKADNSAFTSGDWTNGSVTVSVDAEAGASGIAALTYMLDGGSGQAYANGTPIPFTQEGTHTILFQVTDTAGNSLTAPLAVNIDLTAPSVSFGVNGSETWANLASTSVTVNDSGGSHIVASTLQYAWTTDPAAPTSGWTTFTNGTEQTKAGADGDWYLHIQGQDTAGNSVNTVSNRFRLDNTAPVITLTGPSSMHMTAGGAYTEEGATATDTGGSGVAGPVAVTGAVNANAPGTYTLRYNVSDLAGNAAAEVTRTVTVDAEAPRPTFPRSDDSSAPVVTRPVIDLNGTSLDPADIDTSKPSVTLDVMPKDRAAIVSIPASILTSLEGKNAAFFIEIKTPYGSYQVPVNLASLIPGLKEWVEKNNLKAEEISFKITLTDKSGDKELQAAFANGLPNGKVMGAMVDFHIDILNAKTGQTIGTADQFSKMLTRVIPLPKPITSMPEHWGAFRYNETAKKLEFVPAKSVQTDGVWYVMIRSDSNSAYVVAENATSFTDVQKHWAQLLVEQAAAKGLVEGGGGGRYNPDNAVSRAEFAAMLVRALGRGAAYVGSAAPYDDVHPGAWYFGAVAAAKELGLLGFASGNRFMPDQPLTREEMASMLAAVMVLQEAPIAKEMVNLDGYKDIGKVDASYLEDVRLMVKFRIMTGTGEDTFSPKGETTRAQAAVVFIRTLRQLGMID